MMLDEIRQRAAAGGNPLWWAYRLVEVVAARANAATEEELDLAIDSFVQLATEDPAWAMQSLGDRGPAGHRLGQLRALETGRTADAVSAMRELVALASGLTFLSNEDVSALPARLRESGLCPDLCDSFHALVQKRDWRKLPRLALGERSATIPSMAGSEEVLTYWFGSAAPDEPPGPDRMQLWFRGGEAVDQEIRQRFGDDVERARKGELAGWAETPRGRLALIILLDQFSRNLYRGSGEAFAKDALALELAIEGLDSGQDKTLSCIEQLFFVLPLEHAEDLAMQDRALAYFEAWVKAVPAALQGMGQGACDFAQQHRDVIARFGRFPTRNQALGRASTPEEETHVREAKAAGRPV